MFVYPRGSQVETTCNLIMPVRGVRRSYPRGSVFTVVRTTKDGVLATDRINLAVLLPFGVVQLADPPDRGPAGTPPPVAVSAPRRRERQLVTA